MIGPNGEQRVRRVVEWAERRMTAGGERPARAAPAGRPAMLARVTSDIADAAGDFPAALTRWDEEAGDWDEADEACKLKFANGGTPAVGKRFECGPSHANAAGEGVYVTASCCNVTSPTDPQCPCLSSNGPFCLDFTGSGGSVLNSACTDCDTINTPWTLDKVGTCTFQSEGRTLCVGTYNRAFYTTLSWDGTHWVVDIYLNGVRVLQYATADDSWDCESPLTLQRVSAYAQDFGTCDWPAFIAVTLGDCASSGSGSGSGSGSAGGISSTELGRTSGTGTTLTLSVSVPASNLLVVSAAGLGGGSTVSGVTFNGVAMTSAAAQALTSWPPGDGELSIWHLAVTPATAADVVVTFAAGATASLVTAVAVHGLAPGAPDQSAGATGTTNTPDTGATGTTTASNEYVHCAFVGYHGSFSSFAMGTAGGGFGTGQAVYSNFGGHRAGLVDMYKVASATGTFDGSLNGSSLQDWAGVVVTFK